MFVFHLFSPFAAVIYTTALIFILSAPLKTALNRENEMAESEERLRKLAGAR